LLIDAIYEEALEGCDRIEIWKGASLETAATTGVADYLVAENKDYLETPYLRIEPPIHPKELWLGRKNLWNNVVPQCWVWDELIEYCDNCRLQEMTFVVCL
jgi:hypothetical protein